MTNDEIRQWYEEQKDTAGFAQKLLNFAKRIRADERAKVMAEAH